MSRPKNSSDWQEALKMMNHCPICNSEYRKEQARLFAHHQNAHLVHIKCPRCGSYFVAMIMMLGPGLSSVGMVTDLSYDDVLRLHQTEILSVDDLIDGHEILQSQHFLQTLLERR